MLLPYTKHFFKKQRDPEMACLPSIVILPAKNVNISRTKRASNMK